ncbi:MAG: argininosuccinate synthase [Coriobacteriales bacterium]|jgi:argininosuccinate synthase|nr:argininosuccinate synthase [Coriobacteriales bacterium]
MTTNNSENDTTNNPTSSPKRDVKKAVLAYSGGLDTSIIIPWLKENYGCEVIAMAADVGQGAAEFDGLEEKALATGASALYVADIRDELVTDFIWPTLKAGARYESYLLGTSFARPPIAKALVDVARKEGADAIAHGCTGKGNDQVRFELTAKALAPDLAVIAPWREWDIRSREDAIDYAEAHAVPLKITRTTNYSKDRNLWHLSHEGLDLEDPANEPDYGRILEMGVAPEAAPDVASYVTLSFEQGIPVALDGERLDGVPLVERLNALGGANGIGIIDLVENRLVGMKSRGVYETPGGTILYAAHDALETLCLDKETAHFKQTVAQRYADLVYNGQWYSPLREALDAFVDATQRTVTGEVRLKLYKGNVVPVSLTSPYSLHDLDMASFGESEYDHADATGFINLFGLPMKIAAQKRRAQAEGGRIHG